MSEIFDLTSSDILQEDNDSKDRLISALKEKKAILMVGSGCSKIVGYPLWGELVKILNNNLTPSLVRPDNVGHEVFADKIKNKFKEDGKIKEYYKLLEKIFRPKANQSNYTKFHSTLVKLGFCGIITTNYDEVLEFAVGEAFSSENYHRCDSQDLCLPKPYRIFDFLRSISPDNNHSWVLHLHGCYKNPECMILTREDYLKMYGIFEPDEKNKKVGGILDTIHRKVIWSLLTMHTLVFVGFSMSDPFFMDMLNIVQNDFELSDEVIHFAVMPYKTLEERNDTFLNLKKNGVLPIFYRVNESSKIHSYNALEKLIYELSNSLGITFGSPLNNKNFLN